MQGQVGGDQPQGAGALSGQLLGPAVGDIVQFGHRLEHFFPGPGGDMCRIINDPRDGLIGNARQASNIVKGYGFHARRVAMTDARILS